MRYLCLIYEDEKAWETVPPAESEAIMNEYFQFTDEIRKNGKYVAGEALHPTASRKDDVGFVPLLHLAGDWYFAPDWRLRFDADALAGGPGRAIDAALKLGYDIDRNWTVSAGYRTLEGGADVEEVYAFAWLHYLVGSVSYRW